jgi:hypothetical protein
MIEIPGCNIAYKVAPEPACGVVVPYLIIPKMLIIQITKIKNSE